MASRNTCRWFGWCMSSRKSLTRASVSFVELIADLHQPPGNRENPPASSRRARKVDGRRRTALGNVDCSKSWLDGPV